jgi:ankyrin repeat protein
MARLLPPSSRRPDANAKAGSDSWDWVWDEGWTPLHVSCIDGHKDVVELLIAKGNKVNVKTKTGKTPLDLAKENGHQEIVELLRRHGAKE